MSNYSRQKKPKLSPFNSNGFEDWYIPIQPNITKLEIYLVDFKTEIIQEEQEEEALYDDQNDEYENEISSNISNKKYNDISGILLYFLAFDDRKKQYYKGKAFLKQNPYFYLLLDDGANPSSIIQQIKENYSNRILNIEIMNALDAGDLLFAKEKQFIKIEVSVPSLVSALRERLIYDGVIEWREADILYHHRVSIDKKLNVGNWYNINTDNAIVIDINESSRKDLPPLKLVAYDIETNNDKSKEPDPNYDIITMVSMYSGTDSSSDNVVIVNSDVIDCKDVTNFNIVIRDKDNQNKLPWIDWIKKSEEHMLEDDNTVISYFPMNVQIVKDERELIIEFLKHIQRVKPDILTDFFGDKFDLPFFNIRGKKYNINFEKLTGFIFKKKLGKKTIINWMQDIESVASHGLFHLDAFLWNLRYSYLPKKDLGLKSSVTKKLKIIPIGREALWQMGKENSNPAEAVAYAGSDGYVTWRYVKEIILDFAISMGRMFPVNSSEILTKTAGSLDDLLVDKIGHHRRIIAKKRFQQKGIGYFNSKINIQGITYTGGFVIAPNPGIWRKDLKYIVDIDENSYLDFKKVLAKNLPPLESKILTKSKKAYFDSLIKDYFNNDDEFFNYVNNTKFSNCLQNALRVLDDTQIEKVNEEYKKADSLIIIDTEDRKKELFISIDNVINGTRNLSLKGMHLDVTSMYPSQIRQYKLQPSGIVDQEYCTTCEHREELEIESKPSCAFDSPWTVKIATLKPCIKKFKDNKTPNGYCELFSKACDFAYSEESKCEAFDVGEEKKIAIEEFYNIDENRNIHVYSFENGDFIEKSLKESYLARGFKRNQQNSKDILDYFDSWIQESIEGAKINYKGDYPFRIESGGRNAIIWKGFLYIDVKQKHSSFLVSLETRFCQKAYDYMSSIMDMFFQERLSHKSEAKRISLIIKEKKKKKELIPDNLIQAQKYHDSTQLGMKVPLNSIYGLLGMKGGVHNASLPSAGVTTSLSSRLIQWSADILGKFGSITELDTDGCWFFIPETIPTHFDVEIGFVDNNTKKILKTHSIPIWEEYLNTKTIKEHSNSYYWFNNGETITHQKKSLLSFEQDGPYDFQYVQGKKKYIVYNRNENDGSWEEEELIGLETKRADFSKLHKELQETIISTFLEDWGKTSLKLLYQKAAKRVDEFILKINQGDLDEEYFILPRTIKKRPEEYFSQGPEVIAALMLKDLGYQVEPGIKINYFLIKPINDPKNKIELKVAPQQLFKLPFKEVKKFLRKRGIAQLEFKLGQINSMADIQKNILRIDYDSYIESLIGPGKISDRMIYSIAKKQGIILKHDKNSRNDEFHLNNIILKNNNVNDTNYVPNNKIELYSESSYAKSLEISKQSKNKKSATKVIRQELFKNDFKPNKNVINNNKQSSEKENLLLNQFLYLEGKKINLLVKQSNVRIKKLLPTLKRFYQANDQENYYCRNCNIRVASVKSFSCPYCSQYLYYNI